MIDWSTQGGFCRSTFGRFPEFPVWFLHCSSGWWQLKYFYFHPEPWGNGPIWLAYFSIGLVQPLTSHTSHTILRILKKSVFLARKKGSRRTSSKSWAWRNFGMQGHSANPQWRKPRESPIITSISQLPHTEGELQRSGWRFSGRIGWTFIETEWNALEDGSFSGVWISMEPHKKIFGIGSPFFFCDWSGWN